MIEIDGSLLEGGGSIVRFSVALSALTGEPVRIFNIRAKRKNPGLQAQHLAAVKAVAKLCNAKVYGLEIGSRELKFYPDKLKGGKIDVKISTAGSTMLVLQALLLPAIFCRNNVEVTIRGGGTFNEWAPTYHYFKHVALSALKFFGVDAEVFAERHGFYPRGGAVVKAFIKPCSELTQINLTERGKLLEVGGVSCVANLPRHIAQRQRGSAINLLSKEGLIPTIRIEEYSTLSPGTAITIWCLYENGAFGGSYLGKKGLRAEEVGKRAAYDLLEDLKSRACFDKYLSDQLVPFLALSKSKISVSKLTMHAKTNIEIIKRILGVKIKVLEDEGHVILSC